MLVGPFAFPVAADIATYSFPVCRYEYCPIPPVVYEELEKELWCHNYYLNSLCSAPQCVARVAGGSVGGGEGEGGGCRSASMW